MKICYIWAGERGPFDLCYGHQKTVRPITAWSLNKKRFFGVFNMSISTKIYMRNRKLLQYCKTTAGAKSVSRLRNLWQMTWSACVQTLTLGDRTCCCFLSQQGENPAMSAIWEKKKKHKKEKVLRESKALKKKKKTFCLLHLCTVLRASGDMCGQSCILPKYLCLLLVKSANWQCSVKHACVWVHAWHTPHTHTHAYLLLRLPGAMPGRLQLSA